MHVISCPFYRKETQQPDREWNVPFDLSPLGMVMWLSWAITASPLFPSQPGIWETSREGRVSGLWQRNSFFYPKLDDPAASAAKEQL